MAYEVYDTRGRGGPSTYGTDWMKIPAFSINVCGISINEVAARAFSLTNESHVQLLIDRANRKIALQVLTDVGDGVPTVRLRSDGKKSDRKALSISCGVIKKFFPDCIRKAYRVHLNAGARVIECDLSPGNMLKQ